MRSSAAPRAQYAFSYSAFVRMHLILLATYRIFVPMLFASTFTTGSLLAFLVFGPMIDIKAIGLMLSIFKPKMLIYLFALAAQLTFILTLGYGYIF